MLQRVDVAPRTLEAYEPIVGAGVLEAVRVVAEPLRGLRVAHVNATAYGGGVSELLHSLVPLYRGLGIDCDWPVIPGTPRFFEVTLGLVVAETLWKNTPVVAGRAGGIPLQMPPGIGGYLVDDVAQCVERTVALLRDPDEAAGLGRAGHDHVAERFLITRLLKDDLELAGALLG